MKSLTKLIEDSDLSINAAGMVKCLQKKGVIIEVEYESTTGRGHMNSFKAIAAEYAHFGVNKPSYHKIKTSITFNESALPALITLMIEQLEEDRERLSQLKA